MVSVSVLGCQMRECSQEDGQSEAYEKIWGTKATRLQTGLMMDSGLSTGEWRDPEWQEGQLSSASASKQCLGSGPLVVPAQRGLVIPSHCLRCRMPLLSHSCLSFESMLYQIRRRKALSECICVLPCRALSVAFLKANGCISVILIFLWHLSVCLYSVGGEPPKQHLKGLSCYSSFPLFFALLPKPRKSWNNLSLLVIRHIWLTKYWLQLQNAFRKSNCRKILNMKITYITFYKYKESSKMEADIASFKAGLKILDSDHFYNI